MTPETYRFALWSTLILAVAVAAILYQHAQHTAYVLSQMGANAIPFSPNSPNSDTLASLTADPAATLSSNPGWAGGNSPATGQWTPLGPPGGSVFSYLPPQTIQ